MVENQGKAVNHMTLVSAIEEDSGFESEGDNEESSSDHHNYSREGDSQISEDYSGKG